MQINKGKDKIIFLSGFVICAIIFILINIFITKANYRKTESIPLAKGTINYTLVDFEIVEIKIDGKPSNKMPEGNYELTEDSYCTEKNDQFKDTKNPEIKLTYQNNILSVSNYTKKGTKCHLVFEESLPLLNEIVIAQSTGQTISSFTGPACGSCKVSNENGIYETEDNDGTSYYFRGTVTNNWVKFGENDNGDKDVWWRIVRINGDGTIRLIYSGMFGKNEKPTNAMHETGANTIVSSSQTYSVGGAYNDNTYVGFYTGSTGGNTFDNTHSNQTPSNVATQLKNWYEGNDWNADKYAQYIDENAGFCNDRTINPTPKVWYTSEGDNYRGTGTVPTAYGPFSRFLTNTNSWNSTEQKPTLICGKDPTGTGNEVSESDYQRDLYTPKSASKGNGKLEVPVGLITADEVVFAGGYGGQSNDGYYLYNNQYFWTMSPRIFDSGSANVFRVATSGSLNSAYVGGATGVRPVINLRADSKFTFPNGDENKGTIENPYIVVTE